LILTLGTVYLAGYWILLPNEFTRLGKNIAAVATFTLNFLLQYDIGYFDAAGDRNPILNLWSLCIEEQFYFLFPSVFLISSKLKINRLVVITSIVIGSFSLNVSMVNDQATATFFSPLTRFWELALGSLLAHTFTKISFLETSKGSFFCSAIGLCLITAAIFLIDENLAFPGWFALVPAIGATLVLATRAENKCSDLISNDYMVGVGKISYPLYLWHYPVFSYLRIYEAGEPAPIVMIAGMGLSIFLAFVTYKFVENPIRFGRFKKTGGPWIVTSLVILLLAMGIVGKLTQGKRGIPQRINAEFSTSIEQKVASSCLTVDSPSDATCVISNINKLPTVVLIGDSHASHFAEGLEAYVTDQGGNLAVLSGPGCVPYKGLRTRAVKGDPQTCGEVVEWMYEYLNVNPQIKTVVLATRGPISLTGKIYGEEDVAGRYLDSDMYPEARNQKELFIQALDATLAKLTLADKDVVMILDNPELGFNPQLCEDVPLFRQKKLACSISRAEVDARNDEYRELMHKMQSKYSKVALVDSFEAFCDPLNCYARKDGVMMYRDNNHLTAHGSKQLTPLYAFQVKTN